MSTLGIPDYNDCHTTEAKMLTKNWQDNFSNQIFLVVAVGIIVVVVVVVLRLLDFVFMNYN